MDDVDIIALYFARSEDAIAETDLKYGKLCRYIALNILSSIEDSEECVNDAYFGVWNAIPPQRPSIFSAFISKITRNLALKKYDYVSAAKRNPEVLSSLSELGECVPASDNVERISDEMALVESINRFLYNQPENKRNVFVRRYWYLSSIKDIAKQCGSSESRIKSMLFRMRMDLKQHLSSEGIII